MSNQDQFREQPQAVVTETTQSFSATRRVVTVGLVLVAAGLLGYVLFDRLMTEPPVTVEPNPPTEIVTEGEPTSDTTTLGLLDNPNRTAEGEAETVVRDDLAHILSNDAPNSDEEGVEDASADRMLELLR